MAPAHHLPLYRDAMRLIQHLHQTTKKAPRELRYTLVQRLLDETVETCVDIADANRATGHDRAQRIDRLANRVERVATLLTVTVEQRCMSTGAAGIAMQLCDTLGRQTTGWAKQTSGTAARQNPPSPRD